MNLKQRRKGFTVVELLVVIVVIAILAAISFVAYSGIQERGRNSTAYSLASQVAKMAEVYYSLNNSYPTIVADFSGEADLEDLKVTLGDTSGGPLAATPVASDLNSSSAAVSQFESGNRVLYVADADGYSILYRTGGATVSAITKGSPPAGTWAYLSNENL